MLRVAWRSLRAHKSRLVLSTVAVILGVAFVCGSFVFSDTLKGTFTDLFGSVSSDAVVRPVSDVGGSSEEGGLSLSASVIPEIRAVDGVAEATGEVFVAGVVALGQDGKILGNANAPNFGLNWIAEGEGVDGTLTLEQGRGPVDATEIAMDSKTFEAGELAIGDKLRVLTPGPVVEAELVGVFRFGDTGDLAGASLTAFDTKTAQRLLLSPGQFSQVSVMADEGVSQEELVERVRPVVGSASVEVVTGQQAADENASEINQALSFFDYIILAFAAISLLVGIFLIVNTFAMLVAQRARELALLRALGASRQQVSRSLLVEALVVGIVGSTLGILLGLVIATGLQSLLGSWAGLPEGDLTIATRTIVVSYAVGMLVTLVSAWFPARRASRVPPIAAMRDTVTIPTRSLHRRTAVGGVVTTLGVAALLLGVNTDDTGSAASLVGLGALLTLLGVAVIAPVLAGPMVGLLGWPVRRISKLSGRLAVDNAGRNRARTAGTASALMIGLAVVSTFSIIGATVSASVADAIDSTVGADYIVQPANLANGGFTPEVGAAVAAVPGVAAVTSVQSVPVQIDGDNTGVAGVTPESIGDAITADVVTGSWSDLTASTIGVDDAKAKEDGLAVGDPVEVTFESGPRELELAVIYEDASADLLTGWVVSPAVFDAAGVSALDLALYVNLDEGTTVEEIRPALDAAVEPFPNVTLRDRDELTETVQANVNGLLAFIYIMLALSILIAILGIVNTLALSVIERTREIGLLRAVGMSRKQVKRMIRWESVIIASIGAILGILLGVVFGTALQRVLAGQGLTKLEIPVGQLITFVIVAALVGVLAAWRPARRAARLDVLKAIATD